jgi:MraZ protein
VEEVTQSPPKPEIPLGMYAARVDDKGRIKLPVDFQQYFADLGEKKFFLTSLDGRIGSIYTLGTWRHNLRVMADYTEDAETAEDIGFLADDLGGQAEMDSQGRLLVPAEMRRALGMENQAVRLRAAGERVDILSDKEYAERRARAFDKETNAAKLARLKKRGLK